MEQKKLLFIYNPQSGKAMIRSYLADIIDIFTKGGYEVTASPTQKSGDATEITRERSGEFDLIVCSGGDGTLDEVVTGMMQRENRKPIGYIPAGSTNDFARSLGISCNMIEAADNVMKGKLFPCDVGSFNSDTFVYIAAFGIFTDVSYETDQNAKNVLGYLAYVLEGSKRLNSITSYRVKFSHDGEVYEDDIMLGMITNSMSVGGFRNITGQNVELDDGTFEVTFIRKPETMGEFNAIVRALLGKTIDNDMMYCFKTGMLEIEMEELVPWTLDGEFGGTHKHVVIKNENQALQIIVPEEN